MSLTILYENNDAVVELNGLRNGVTGEFINDADVSVTVLKEQRPKTSGEWPIVMQYVEGTRGTYRGVLPAALAIKDGDRVDVVVTAIGGGLTAEFSTPARVQRRSFS